MFNFTTLDTYDKTEAKVLKQQLDAAYNLGTAGTEVNQVATDALNKSKADVAALSRVQQMFSEVPLKDKLHSRINFRLSQENKWLAHHTKCVEATKRGFEKMKAAAKAAGLIDEAFAAGEAEAEKKLKLKNSTMQSKADENKNKGKEVDPKFQQRDGNDQNNKQQNQNQNQNDQNKDKQNQNKAAPVTIVVENLVVAKGKKAKKYAGANNGFVQRKPH